MRRVAKAWLKNFFARTGIGEGGVQLLADDAADEIAKYRREIRTESVGAVYGRTGALNCATRAGKLAPAPPDSENGRRLEKPSGFLGAGGALSSRVLLASPVHELGERGGATRRGDGRDRAPPFACALVRPPQPPAQPRLAGPFFATASACVAISCRYRASSSDRK